MSKGVLLTEEGARRIARALPIVEAWRLPLPRRSWYRPPRRNASGGVLQWAKITAKTLISGSSYRYYYSGTEMEPTATGFAVKSGGATYSACIIDSFEYAHNITSSKQGLSYIPNDAVVALLTSFVSGATTYYYCQAEPPKINGYNGIVTVVIDLVFDPDGCLESWETKDLAFEYGLLKSVT